MKDPLENISHDFKKDTKEMDNKEINEKVAKALGWRKIEYGEMRISPACGLYCDSHWEREKELLCRIPDYSGSIEAAWEIVEHQGDFQLSQGETGWTVSIGYGNDNAVFATADTAPMAICLAFLKLIDSRSEAVTNEVSEK